LAGREVVSDTEDNNELTFEIGKSATKVHDPDELRQRIMQRKNDIDSNFLKLAYDLFLVRNNHTYLKWNYESFDSYVISELGMVQSTASELIRVWSKFRGDLMIPEEEIYDLGFSKALLLVPVVSKKNIYDWIDRAKVKTRSALELDIKTWKVKNPKQGIVTDNSPAALAALAALKDAPDMSSPKILDTLPKEEILIKKSFYLYPRQLELVNTVVNEERTKTDSVKQGNNLVCALTELLVARGQYGDKSEKKPHTILGLFESAFGGKVMWFKSDEQIRLIEKIISDNPDSFEKEGSNG
jgi:hypothetical protein